MKEFKGTPGNYKVGDNINLYDVADPVYTVRDSNNHIVAFCFDEHDVKLLSAAPDLLKCLNNFVKSCYVGCTKDQLNELRQKAEVAIAKGLY